MTDLRVFCANFGSEKRACAIFFTLFACLDKGKRGTLPASEDLRLSAVDRSALRWPLTSSLRLTVLGEETVCQSDWAFPNKQPVLNIPLLVQLQYSSTECSIYTKNILCTEAFGNGPDYKISAL